MCEMCDEGQAAEQLLKQTSERTSTIIIVKLWWK